ncbi:MAG: ABC transporter ATP-binding protein [Syntrophorhabdales bacterium]|jgi:putative ABC transport system ATP-binding protein
MTDVQGKEESGPAALIRLANVAKSFPTPYGEIHALRGVSLDIRQGQLIALTGKSGSGKSTLLNVMTGIDRPTSGSVTIGGVCLESLPEGPLARWRGRNIGVVFQFFQLLPTLTVLENVMLPMDFCNTFRKKERIERALALLERVGIEDQARKLPSALSGGQQQRAAIARALANDPPIVVADEPTGNLDSVTAISMFELFAEAAQAGKTVVVVTHERDFSQFFELTVVLADGVIKDNADVLTADAAKGGLSC